MPEKTPSKDIKRFWTLTIRNEAGAEEVELLVYGDIGADSWSDEFVGAKAFAEALSSVKGKHVKVRINSYGGDVFAGQAIYSMLKRHPGGCTTIVDGIAASAASIIAMAGDTVIMPENAMLMIHNPWCLAYGNASDFRKTADDMDKIGSSLVAVYVAKTGKTEDEIRVLLDAETWMTAQEAVDMGFADEIEAAREIAASISDGMMRVVSAAGEAVVEAAKMKRTPPEWMRKPENKAVPQAKGEVHCMPKSREELEKEYAEVFAQIRAEAREEGVKAERERQAAIDKLAIPGTEALVKAARETGETPEALAVRIVQDMGTKGAQYLSAAKRDAEAVVAIPAAGIATGDDAAERARARDVVKKTAARVRGGGTTGGEA